jgi:hypothetical protein
MEPTTNEPNEGRVQRPATSGDSPRTSCRYWKMKKNVPNRTRMPSV